MINFFIKFGKVIEIYNFCYYDYDYFFFKIAITITISIANRKDNRLGNRKSNRSDCLSLAYFNREIFEATIRLKIVIFPGIQKD